MTALETLKSVASKALEVAVFVVLFLLATLLYMLVAKVPLVQFTRLFGFSFVAGVLGSQALGLSKTVGSWLSKLLKLQ